MKKIIKKRLTKIWGYEDWLSSPLKSCQTKTIDNELIESGPLIKIIKTNAPLSVQVHPDDRLAQKLENSLLGKSECWYVLETSNEPFILGLKTNNLVEVTSLIKNQQWDKLLQPIKVNRNDFINVPAGLVHAIPANTKVVEIQQPTDITYRFYDYNRYQNGKLRPLHLKKSLLAIKNKSWKLAPITKKPLTYKNEIATIEIWDKPHRLSWPAIVVNLNDENAYLCSAGEQLVLKEKHIVVSLR